MRDLRLPPRCTIGCPETSVRNYHYSLRNNPEDGSAYCVPIKKTSYCCLEKSSLFIMILVRYPDCAWDSVVVKALRY